MIWKRCRKCSLDKPLYLFNLKPLGKLGHDSICKKCHALRIKLYRQSLKLKENHV